MKMTPAHRVEDTMPWPKRRLSTDPPTEELEALYMLLEEALPLALLALTTGMVAAAERHYYFWSAFGHLREFVDGLDGETDLTIDQSQRPLAQINEEVQAYCAAVRRRKQEQDGVVYIG